MEPTRHQAILRLLKCWACRVGEDRAYGRKVKVKDILADDVVEAVIRQDLLRQFDPPDDPERLKRRALERVRQARRAGP
jgi:hypothetical protein